MNHSLVSVIIPFFNEEAYLNRAISSVLQQSYSRIELILVNDGSTDQSSAIAEDVSKKHNNVVLIHTEHHSLGKARNIGQNAAKGDYISFLDADDEFEPQAIEIMVCRIEHDQSDIVIGRFKYLDRFGECYGTGGWTCDQEIIDSGTAIKSIYEHRLAYTVWAKLYRSGLAKQVQFPEGLWFEDRPYLIEYLLKANKVSFEKECLLSIHSRPESITRRTIQTKRIDDVCRIFNLEFEMIQKEKQSQDYRLLLFRHQIGVLMNTLVILISDRQKVANLAQLQNSFNLGLSDFIKKIVETKTKLGKRDKFDLLILSSFKYLGWHFAYLLMPILKYKKFTTISKIRN